MRIKTAKEVFYLIIFGFAFPIISCANTNENNTQEKEFIRNIICSENVECEIEILKREDVRGDYFPQNKCFENVDKNKKYEIFVVAHKDYPKNSPLQKEYVVVTLESKKVIARGLGEPQDNECKIDLGEKGFGNDNSLSPVRSTSDSVKP
ncbi:MAG TPA: hypothetical protein PLV42_02755 [bacterium]|nr:hypothetical protein [bacterium]